MQGSFKQVKSKTEELVVFLGQIRQDKAKEITLIADKDKWKDVQ